MTEAENETKKPFAWWPFICWAVILVPVGVWLVRFHQRSIAMQNLVNDVREVVIFAVFVALGMASFHAIMVCAIAISNDYERRTALAIRLLGLPIAISSFMFILSLGWPS